MRASRRSGHPLVAGLMVLGSAVCFATLPTMTKVAYDHGAEPLGMLVIRFTVAGAILLAIAHFAVRPLRPRREHRQLLLLSLLFACQALSFFGALSLSSATIAVLLLYTYPLVVTLVAGVFLGEQITRATLLVLAVGFSGIVLTVGNVGGDLNGWGVALGLSSGVLFAGVMIVSKRVLAETPPLEMIGLMYLVTSLIYVALASVYGFVTPDDSTGWLALAGVIVVGTLIAMVLLIFGLDRLPAGVASTLTILEPAVAIAIAAVVLGETVSATQGVGIALVLTALLMLGVLIARSPIADPPPAPPA
jgi:drug/metabolite transporter (DMT)-like permease